MKKCFFFLACLFALLIIPAACSAAPGTAPASGGASETASSPAISTAPAPAESPASPDGPVTPTLPSPLESAPVVLSPSEAPPATAPAVLAQPSSGPSGTAAVLPVNATPEKTIPDSGTHQTRQEEHLKPQRVRVPILYYHSISDIPIGIEILSVTTGDFEKQMKYLRDNGYTSIFLNENPAAVSKPVIITLDDGYVDNFTYAYPILEKYNMKATIFIITDFIGAEGYLSVSQMKSMQKLVSFQSHTVTHSLLDELDEAQIIYELKESREILAAITQEPVYALCYPVGHYDRMVLRLTERYYDCAVTIQQDVATKILGNYQIPRIFVGRYGTLADFKESLN